MTASSLVAASIGAAVVAVALMGCGAGSEGGFLRNFVEVSCKVTVDNYVDKVQAGYMDFVIDNCAKIRKKAEEELVNEERGEQIEQKCLDTAGVGLEEDTEAQKENYTTMCVHAVMNGTDSSYSHLKALVTDFWEGQNLTGDFQDMVGEHLNKTFTDILDEYSVTGGLGTTKGEPGSSGGNSSSSGGSSKETKLLKLSEEGSTIQWDASDSSRSLLPAAGYGLVALLAMATALMAVRGLRRREVETWTALDHKEEAE